MTNDNQLRMLCVGPILAATVGLGCADDEVRVTGSDGIADPGEGGEGNEGDEGDEGDEGGGREPGCGNGEVEAGEACDDGNAADDDACTNACELPSCGDGIVQADQGEDCDDGNVTPGDGCTVNCHLPGTVIADYTSDLFTVGNAVVVDSADQIIVLGHAKGGLPWIAKFDDQFNAHWNKESLPGVEQGLAIGTNDELLVSGELELKARTRRVNPSDGSEIWLGGSELIPSDFTSVASVGEHMVSAGRLGKPGNQIGLVMRHHGDTGDSLTIPIQWNNGPFGPVAVDASGWIWVIDGDKDAGLHIYTSNNELEDTVGLASGMYEDLVVDDDRNVYLLAHSIGEQSFTLSKYKEDGAPAWPPYTYDDASASGLALGPGGVVLVAGHTSDETNGLLVWFDQTEGELIDERVVGSDGNDGQYEVFHDIAVAQSGAFAVAVGGRGLAPNNTALWIYKVEL